MSQIANNRHSIYSFLRSDNEIDGGFPRVYAKYFNEGGTAYSNQPLTIVGQVHACLDHQAHIIPQNLLALVLQGTLDTLSIRLEQYLDEIDWQTYCKTHNYDREELSPRLRKVLDRVVTDYQLEYLWLRRLYNFFEGRLWESLYSLKFEDDNFPRECIDTIMGVVVWHPINICNAPGDDTRKQYPTSYPDYEVISTLVNRNLVGVDDLTFLLAKAPVLTFIEIQPNTYPDVYCLIYKITQVLSMNQEIVGVAPNIYEALSASTERIQYIGAKDIFRQLFTTLYNSKNLSLKRQKNNDFGQIHEASVFLVNKMAVLINAVLRHPLNINGQAVDMLFYNELRDILGRIRDFLNHGRQGYVAFAGIIQTELNQIVNNYLNEFILGLCDILPQLNQQPHGQRLGFYNFDWQYTVYKSDRILKPAGERLRFNPKRPRV
jgi:hypothetical protein